MQKFREDQKNASTEGVTYVLEVKKFAKTKKWNSKKSEAQAQPADALKHMTDYPRTNSTCFHGRPSSCKCISTRSAGLGRERGRCIGRRSAIWRLPPGTIQDGRVGQSLNIDLLDGNDPPWLEQILYILVRRMQWCCQHVEKTKPEQKQSKCDEAGEEEQHQVQDCEQKSSG